MPGSARERLAELLAGAATPKAFSASRTAPTGDLELEVRGVGPIALPVSQAQARQLCLIARPARHGRGELTVLDRGVRDTWEIPKSRVKIDRRRWNRTLLPMLERLGRDLGLPAGRTLTAELHSMLVYARGQFFVAHQDSEKDDAMVGSLVVGLPSTFKGGSLVVRHGGTAATYRGSKTSLSFVAFYSDCRHEVRPVTSGHRVVLTYNVLLRSDPHGTSEELDPTLVDGLAGCLADHFGPDAGSDRLVYLLDHEYTRRGLGWPRLKGADAHRAALLKAAAERAGCEATLALANVHESWTAYEHDERDWHGARWGHDHWNEDDDDEPLDERATGTGEYDLEDLIESEVTLDSWIDPAGDRVEQVDLPIPGDEVAASTPTAELEPYSSEYEGYMGNWGNTLDRWYHRGAVALWPRSNTFAVRAEAFPPAALDELIAGARTGDLATTREQAWTLASFWHHAVGRIDSKGFFAKALRAAQALDDGDLAAMLVHPFALEQLTPSHAKPLATVVGAYGEPWAVELVVAWSARRQSYYSDSNERNAWIAMLPELCGALRQAGDSGAAVARLLVSATWTWLGQTIDRRVDVSPPSHRERALSELAEPLASLLQSASTIDAGDVDNAVASVLCRDELLLACAIATLRATPPTQKRTAGLTAIASHCTATLDARLARPPRAAEDWSIELPKGCDCELCADLRAFLASPAKTRLEWPLAQQRRRHVHARIDTAELPLTHTTRRAGRPFTLVLTKTDALHSREAQRRRQDEEDLIWLRRTRRW